MAKDISKLLAALEMLVYDANRISSQFGINADGTKSDWSEWVNLRRSIVEARYQLKSHGIKTKE